MNRQKTVRDLRNTLGKYTISGMYLAQRSDCWLESIKDYVYEAEHCDTDEWYIIAETINRLIHDEWDDMLKREVSKACQVCPNDELYLEYLEYIDALPTEEERLEHTTDRRSFMPDARSIASSIVEMLDDMYYARKEDVNIQMLMAGKLGVVPYLTQALESSQTGYNRILGQWLSLTLDAILEKESNNE